MYNICTMLDQPRRQLLHKCFVFSGTLNKINQRAFNSSGAGQTVDAMPRARSFFNVTACRAVSNPAWCRIFRVISCSSSLNIGTSCRCFVIGQGTSPSQVPLDSGVSEYLVGQRWQCVRLVPSAEMATSAVCSKKYS